MGPLPCRFWVSLPGQDPGQDFLQYASVHVMPEATGPVYCAADQLYICEAICEYQNILVLVGYVVHCIVQCCQLTSEGCVEVCGMACAPGCPVSCLTFTLVTRAVVSCRNRLVLLAAICIDVTLDGHTGLLVPNGHRGAEERCRQGPALSSAQVL